MNTPILPGFSDLTQIGKGGFSRVYRGTQQKFSRSVAIKVLNFGLAEAADRASFERETQLMGRVSAHPNIVTVYDTAFTKAGQPCIVMELYSGGSLAELIGEHGSLGPAEVIDVGVAIASALDTSHAGGVLHCDLKPQNILISDYGQPALTDFGISTFEEERTRTGSGAGFTLHYAAPEVIEGASPSAASDVYSLAATLYTALAGQRPFATAGSKQSAGETARRVLLEEPAALADLGVPAPIDTLIRQAMAKQPEERPRSAAAFAQQLFQAGQSLGYGTAPPSTSQRPPLPGVHIRTRVETDDETTVAPPRPTAGSATPAPVIQPVRRAEPARKNASRTASQGDVTSDTVFRSDVNLAIDETPVEAVTNAPSRRRTVLAGVVALLSVLGVGAALWFSSGQGDEADTPTTESRITATAPVVDPVLAPDAPTNVTLERLGVTAVRVSFDAELSDDVVFEVRRTDQSGASPVRTNERTVVLQGVPASEAPCVIVLALRSNRHSPATDPICLAPKTGAWVDVRPEVCDIGNCQVRLDLAEFPASTRVSILVLNPDGLDINGFGDAYENSATTDARGKVDSWRLTLPPLLPAGEYLVVVADDVGESYSNVFTAVSGETD